MIAKGWRFEFGTSNDEVKICIAEVKTEDLEQGYAQALVGGEAPAEKKQAGPVVYTYSTVL